MQLIDGKATAAKIKEEIAAEVKDIMAKGGKQPHLALFSWVTMAVARRM